MKQKNILIILLAMCWSALVLSQNYSQSDSLYVPRLTGDVFVEQRYHGSPFVTPDWTNSIIVLSTGDTIVGEKIKYNGYIDEVIWINQHNFKKFRLDKSNITEFWIQPDDSHTIHYKKMTVPITPGNQKVFLEANSEEKLALYVYRKIIRSGSINERYEDLSYSLDILTPKNIYFFTLPDGRWIEMGKLRLKNLLKYFPAQKKAITQLAKKNHLNFSSETQCIALIHLINKEILTPDK